MQLIELQVIIAKGSSATAILISVIPSQCDVWSHGCNQSK